MSAPIPTSYRRPATTTGGHSTPEKTFPVSYSDNGPSPGRNKRERSVKRPSKGKSRKNLRAKIFDEQVKRQAERAKTERGSKISSRRAPSQKEKHRCAKKNNNLR